MILDYLDIDNEVENKATFNKIQTICPFCQTGVQYIERFGLKNRAGYFFFMECPTCGYCWSLHNAERNDKLLNLTKTTTEIKLLDRIKELSPDFCEIYKQSIQAEQLGLFTIVGTGFCKSLEVLVSDYLKKVQNETPTFNFSQNIKKLKGFEDDIIQLSFSRLIRNDTVHPEKTTDYTIDDLKESIDCLIAFFDAKYSTFKLSQKLNKSK